MKKLIVANWKGLPATLGEAEEIINRVDEKMRELDTTKFGVVICPPMVFLEDVARLIEGAPLQLGAQDMDAHLAKLGVRYVIIGHSDRRWKLGESDEIINEKLKQALVDGLTPIVCLGERSREGAWQDELTAQMRGTFRGLTPGQISHCLIAYEPVWAISTNPDAKPDTPASAVHSMNIIREALAEQYDVSAPTFLYGGSITSANAADFLSRPEISGVLVGGASVRIGEFLDILTVATHLS